MPNGRVTPLESTEQQDFVGWVKHLHPGIMVFAIPNGGARDKRTAARLKLEGVLPGVPDLMIPEPRRHWHGLFIEMKRQGAGPGAESADQRQVRHDLMERGYCVRVCAGRYDAYAVFCAYLGIPNRFKSLHKDKRL